METLTIKQQRIFDKIKAHKDIMKYINNNEYFNIEEFYNNSMRYIKAIKDGRMICNINSVSKSGMSRTIKFTECAKNSYDNRYMYLNFLVLFEALGYNVNHKGYTRIGGCGMDMIFHTNYSIIHRLTNLGFMSPKQCSGLAQMTPSVI